LDVAVGSGSAEITKYRLEFHRAKSTRETLRMALSTANLELVNLVLAWLSRDSSVFEGELLSVFALEHQLADALVIAFESGFLPWWGETRAVPLKWRVAAKVQAAAPDGFSADGGWWTDPDGTAAALPPCDEGDEWTLPASIDRERLVHAILPPGVRSIAEGAFWSCSVLTRVRIPWGVTAIGDGAFCACVALTEVDLPATVTTIEAEAFKVCLHVTRGRCPSVSRASGRGLSASVKVWRACRFRRA
jgi:hypothetical protein